MYSALILDVARDAVAHQFSTTEEQTELALQATPAPSIRRTRTRLADMLHHLADAVAPAAHRTAHPAR